MQQIDREPVQLLPIPVLSTGDDDDDNEHRNKEEEVESPGSTEIQLGGLNTTDPRFTAYKGYTGCISSKWDHISLSTIFTRLYI